MKQCPDALNALSLLSHTPDGIRRQDMSRFLSHMAEEMRTEVEETLVLLSLVVKAEDRLRVLAPVRAYMAQHYPAAENELASIGNHFIQFLKGLEWGRPAVNASRLRISSEFGNINTVFLYLLSRGVMGDEICDAVVNWTFYMRATNKHNVGLIEECLRYERRTDRGPPHVYHENWKDYLADVHSVSIEHVNSPGGVRSYHKAGNSSYNSQMKSVHSIGNTTATPIKTLASPTTTSKELDHKPFKPSRYEVKEKFLFSPNITYTKTSLTKLSELPSSEWPPFGCLEAHCMRNQISLSLHLATFQGDLDLFYNRNNSQNTCLLFERAQLLARLAKFPDLLILTLRRSAWHNTRLLQFEYAESFLKEAYDLCNIHNLRLLEAGTLRALAFVLQERGEFQRQRKTLEEALLICGELDASDPEVGDTIALCYSSLGKACFGLGDHTESIRHLINASEVHKRLEDFYMVAFSLWWTGAAYHKLEELDKANWYIAEAETVADRNGLNKMQAGCLIMRGIVRYDQYRYEEALELLRDGWNMRLEHDILGDRGRVNEMIGLCHRKLGEGHEASAIAKFKEAKLWYEQEQNPEKIASCEREISELGEVLRSRSIVS